MVLIVPAIEYRDTKALCCVVLLFADTGRKHRESSAGSLSNFNLWTCRAGVHIESLLKAIQPSILPSPLSPLTNPHKGLSYTALVDSAFYYKRHEKNSPTLLPNPLKPNRKQRRKLHSKALTTPPRTSISCTCAIRTARFAYISSNLHFI